MLEDALELTLFERGTRVMQLTDAGKELLGEVRGMADAATQISRLAAGQSQSAAGTVRITCSDALATYELPSIVVSFQKKHPGIQIELFPTNEMSDLTRRDADIAIRHVRPQQPDLIAKRLDDLDIGFFASRDYLSSLGPMEAPEDFSVAQFIGYGSAERLVPQLKAMGIPATKNNFVAVSDNGPVMFELIRQGGGIGPLSVKLAKRYPELVRILPDVAIAKLETWLVTHRELHTSRRIRYTFDHLAAELFRNG